MKKYIRFTTLGMFVVAGGCVPDNFVPNLVGSTISEVLSVVLSDLLNTFLPPI